MATDNLTVVDPIGLLFSVLMALLLVLVPRRYALVPVIVLICFMTLGQRVVVASLDFTMIRLLTLFGWLRLISRNELRPLTLNRIDNAVLWYTFSSCVAYVLLWQSMGAFVNRLGMAYDIIGTYFLFRFLLRAPEDIRRTIIVLAVVMVPLAGAMCIEHATRHNVFAVFGGVPAITQIREGRLRCQGPFAHPILAGTFGAAALPLMLSLWWQRGRYRHLAVMGIVSSTLITYTSGSSGPLMTYAAALLGMSMWPMRRHMRTVRWSLATTLFGLHLVMKAPIWFLIARVNIVGGSTGYHRAFLIDRAIANISDWWLVGTKSTVVWGGRLYDVTNQYIRVGVNGGLTTMLLFVLVLARCFGAVGKRVKEMKASSFGDRILVWSLGSSLLAHAVTFLSVSYFDQNIIMLYLLFAMIATVNTPFVENRPPDRHRAKHTRRFRLAELAHTT